MEKVNIALYLAWNENNYEFPSGTGGDLVNGGIGYGGEEWNNSHENIMKIGNEAIRVFYSIANIPNDIDKVYNIYFWSSNSDAYLLGYALDVKYSTEEIIAKYLDKIDLKKRIDAAWSIDEVRNNYKKYNKLEEDFNLYKNSFCKYYCSSDNFFWFNNPIAIDIYSLGKDDKKPAYRYQNVNIISEDVANKFNDLVFDKGVYDIGDISSLTKTEKDYIVKIRLSQGKFRTSLMKEWENKCAVTGIDYGDLLVASHIKPWSLSNDKEKNDKNNGLLLSRNVDALFDKFLISFDENGDVIISNKLPKSIIKKLEVSQFKLSKKPNKEQAKYLKFHTKTLLEQQDC